MIYTYLLCDDGGVSNSENEILLPLKTVFRHEFGKYTVVDYRDIKGDPTNRFSEISMITCERISK